jgi:hypothetical protein
LDKFDWSNSTNQNTWMEEIEDTEPIVLEQDENPSPESKIGQFLQKKMQQLVQEETEIIEAEHEVDPNIIFRNYKPHDKLLSTRVLENLPLNIQTDQMLFEILGGIHAEMENQEIQLVPTKQNYDLKRDLAKKLKTLNVMTQKAIIELRNGE